MPLADSQRSRYHHKAIYTEDMINDSYPDPTRQLTWSSTACTNRLQGYLIPSTALHSGTRYGRIMSSRKTWPELVGKTGEEAKEVILNSGAGVDDVQIIPDGSMVTMDYRQDRVRIFVDANGIVVRAPMVGWKRNWFRWTSLYDYFCAFFGGVTPFWNVCWMFIWSYIHLINRSTATYLLNSCVFPHCASYALLRLAYSSHDWNRILVHKLGSALCSVTHSSLS